MPSMGVLEGTAGDLARAVKRNVTLQAILELVIFIEKILAVLLVVRQVSGLMGYSMASKSEMNEDQAELEELIDETRFDSAVFQSPSLFCSEFGRHLALNYREYGDDDFESQDILVGIMLCLRMLHPHQASSSAVHAGLHYTRNEHSSFSYSFNSKTLFPYDLSCQACYPHELSRLRSGIHAVLPLEEDVLLRATGIQQLLIIIDELMLWTQDGERVPVSWSLATALRENEEELTFADGFAKFAHPTNGRLRQGDLFKSDVAKLLLAFKGLVQEYGNNQTESDPKKPADGEKGCSMFMDASVPATASRNKDFANGSAWENAFYITIADSGKDCSYRLIGLKDAYFTSQDAAALFSSLHLRNNLEKNGYVHMYDPDYAYSFLLLQEKLLKRYIEKFKHSTDDRTINKALPLDSAEEEGHLEERIEDLTFDELFGTAPVIVALEDGSISAGLTSLYSAFGAKIASKDAVANNFLELFTSKGNKNSWLSEINETREEVPLLFAPLIISKQDAKGEETMTAVVPRGGVTGAARAAHVLYDAVALENGLLESVREASIYVLSNRRLSFQPGTYPQLREEMLSRVGNGWSASSPGERHFHAARGIAGVEWSKKGVVAVDYSEAKPHRTFAAGY